MTFLPLGYGQVSSTVGSTGTALPSQPAGAQSCIIQVTGNAVRWRDDGTNPSSIVGMQLAAAASITYYGNISAVRITPETSTTAVVNVTYYGPNQ